MIFDYETLKIIWWLFICLLFIGFTITGGMDLGVNTLLPLIGKNDLERRQILNSIGPTWEGNQVWFLLAAGALFAAFPIVYAAAFSSLYFALFLVLFLLIIRPPGIDYRSKLPSDRWRKSWDLCLFASGVIPSVIFGVAIGNLFQGIPFSLTGELRVNYSGGFFSLLSINSILFGIASLSLVVVQGGTFLQHKLNSTLAKRAQKHIKISAWIFISVFIIIGLNIAFRMQGYSILSIPDVNQALIPLSKKVTLIKTAWLYNYSQLPALWLFPILSIISMLITIKYYSFLSSSICCATTIFTSATAMFPFILTSSTHPEHSLTLWDSASSHKTLQLMFWAAIIFLPIVITYTSWVYRIMRGKVKIADNSY